MTRHLLLCLAIGAALVGCGAAPVPPAWQGNAYGALDAALEAYLGGDTRVADADLARVRAAIARTGQPALLARAELAVCAAHVASLDFDGCPAWQVLAADAAPPERAYAAYLYGNVSAAEIALLPEQHRAVAASAGAQALPRVQDPLARLIAAGVLLRTGRLDPQGIVAAGETASAQGWRRPLLAWLGVQLRRADDAGDQATARVLRRRIDLVTHNGRSMQ